MYCIVDIETSGGKYRQEKMIEIAIYKYDGVEVVDSFSTLVNPEKSIDKFVQRLTGITEKMIKRAPTFPSIAKRIIEITEGTTIVGHDAAFDYRILKQEYKSLGYEFNRPTICTISLAKYLMPELESYSLGKISKALGLMHTDKHRAFGDAQATLELFKLLLERDEGKEIVEKSIAQKIYAKYSPKLLVMLDELPNETGIVYYHNSKDRIFFCTVGRDMQGAARSYFTNDDDLSKKIQNKTHKLTFEPTGSELIASIKKSQTVKKLNLHLNKKEKSVKKTSLPIQYPLADIIFTDKGKNANEQSFFVIKKNKFVGYGYYEINYQISTDELISNRMVKVRENNFLRNIIANYLTNHPEKVTNNKKPLKNKS